MIFNIEDGTSGIGTHWLYYDGKNFLLNNQSDWNT